MLSREATHTNFIVIGLIRPGSNPRYITRDLANHYITNAFCCHLIALHRWWIFLYEWQLLFKFKYTANFSHIMYMYMYVHVIVLVLSNLTHHL